MAKMNTLVHIKPQKGQCSICETPQSLVAVCTVTGLAFGQCCGEEMISATENIANHGLRFGIRHPQTGDDFGIEQI